MIGGLVIAGILIFLFGLLLMVLDVKQTGSLQLWDNGPRLRGVTWVLVCVLGLFLIGMGALSGYA